MGTLQVGGTTLATKNSSTGKVDLHDTNISFPPGHIIQTQFTQTTVMSTQDIPSNTDTAITSLTVNITPLFNNSIIKLESYLFGEWSDVNNPHQSVAFFYRDTTALGNTDSNPGNRLTGIALTNISYFNGGLGSTPDSWNINFFDRPNDGTNSIAQITYKVGVKANDAADLHINGCKDDSSLNVAYVERGCSYISATEIAQSGNGTITPAKAS